MWNLFERKEEVFKISLLSSSTFLILKESIKEFKVWKFIYDFIIQRC